MGEVYKARDTRLGRDVAIKVLPQHLSANHEVRARFEREAKTVSSLNHPHICTLFDVGREGEIDYLVMELVEGETLATRLAKGALPAAETLRIGVQIADALDRAHRAGVVHRDLKPGNIMLTRAGAKLMDFGLARAVGLAGAGGLSTGVTVGALTQSPTVAQPLTAEGTIIGTFQYMSPEQLEGKESDARSDLWALGCVLYEMATGRRTFDGKSQASLITSIMGSQPAPVSQIAPMTPPALDRLVSGMLAKDPADRVQNAHDVKLQLQWIADGGSSPGAPAVTPARAKPAGAWLPWAIAGAAAIAAAFFAWDGRRPHDTANLAVEAAILPPPGVAFSSSTDNPLPIAVSPDGRTIAFCARNGEGPDLLWVRSIDNDDTRAIAGTQGAEGPFFSPDGRSVGFFTKGKLKRVDVTGGAVITLVERVDARGGSWNREGIILYGNSAYGPLWTVKEDGGAPTTVTAMDTANGESTHRYPCFLPDGKHFLYLARRAGAGSGRSPTIYVGELGSNQRTKVLEVASNVTYASGHLLYVREGVLVAQRFDPNSFAVSGSAIPLIDDARMDERFSRGVFSASANGVLVCMTGKNQTRTQLQWLDRKGTLLANVGEPADYTYGGTPELSPDGTTSAMPIANRERGTSDVWLIDLASGRRRRLTVDSLDHPAATWSADGKRVVVSSSAVSDEFMMDVMSIDGTRLHNFKYPRRLFYWPRSVSPDGRQMLFDSPDGAILGQANIGVVDLVTDSMTTVISGGEHLTALPQFSPDGRWFVYQSNESGSFEVYVTAYPSGGKWQVSQGGGVEPRWRNDGRELYYVDSDNYIVAMDVMAGSSFEAGPPSRLFQFHGAGGQWRYDVSADGSRFLVTRALKEDLASPVTLVTDWLRKTGSR